MLISKAYAQALETSAPVVEAMAEGTSDLPPAPSAMEAFVWNMGLVLILVLLFYVLLIRPQQKRMAAHTEMLQGLKKGDKVVTGGGLVGKIDKIRAGSDEVIIDLGDGLKVTALRSTIHNKNDGLSGSAPANDAKADDKAAKAK